MTAPTGDDGVLLADKPRGITSHDAVARARRALGVRRIGHAGTLDPFATGLLILLVGRATRLQQLFMALPKTYEVIARFGATSTTGDTEGEITETGVPAPEPLELPRGRIRQRPPAYSAVKVDGQRAYDRARRGESFELAEREVEIYSAQERWREDDRVALRISCSAGTYVRSLVADLGDAYCLELRRTQIGPFEVEGGWPTEGPADPLGIAIACRRFMPVIRLDPAAVRAVRHGQRIAAPTTEPVFLLADTEGTPVAVAQERDGVAIVRLLL